MIRGSRNAAVVLGMAAALFLAGGTEAGAQEWSDYLHWPYVSPNTPANGFDHQQLYDGHHLYPREMRVYPQIPGPGYYNFYSGQMIHGKRTKSMLETGHNYRMFQRNVPGPINWLHSYWGQRFYYGNHFKLDVF